MPLGSKATYELTTISRNAWVRQKFAKLGLRDTRISWNEYLGKTVERGPKKPPD